MNAITYALIIYIGTTQSVSVSAWPDRTTCRKAAMAVERTINVGSYMTWRCEQVAAPVEGEGR